jgi:RNA polymerase sigma-70 factor (ECF subfamily)
MKMLYRNYRAMLVAYATGFTSGDHQRAEDLFQEAMIRAWQNSERLQATPEMIRPWLFKVVRRLAIDSHRAVLARPPESEETVLAHLTVDDPTDRVLTGHVVGRALARLSLPHRQMLLHRYLLDRSVEETASELGIATGTVKSRSSHALRALRESLDDLEAVRAA